MAKLLPPRESNHDVLKKASPELDSACHCYTHTPPMTGFCHYAPIFHDRPNGRTT